MQFGGDSVKCDFNCLNLPLLASLRSNATSPKFSRAQFNPSGSAVSLCILILILVLHVLEITWFTFILDINKTYFKLVQTWTHNLSIRVYPTTLVDHRLTMIRLYWLIHCTFFSLRWSNGNYEIIAMNAMNLQWKKRLFSCGKFAKNWNFKEITKKKVFSF